MGLVYVCNQRGESVPAGRGRPSALRECAGIVPSFGEDTAYEIRGRSFVWGGPVV